MYYKMLKGKEKKLNKNAMFCFLMLFVAIVPFLCAIKVSDVLHCFSKEIYRQKLQQCVADGELNEEDVAILLRLRVMLCIPQQTVEAAHADICGSLFEKVIIFS